jgi:hypothetical protein
MSGWKYDKKEEDYICKEEPATASIGSGFTG